MGDVGQTRKWNKRISRGERKREKQDRNHRIRIEFKDGIKKNVVAVKT